MSAHQAGPDNPDDHAGISKLDAAKINSSAIPRPLSADDIREIVRDEINKYMHEATVDAMRYIDEALSGGLAEGSAS